MTDKELENIENTDEEKVDVPAEETPAADETSSEEDSLSAEVTSESDGATDTDTSVSENIQEQAGSDIYKWYAVRIIAGHENKVKLYLDNNIKEEHFESKIRTVLIPLEKVFEVKNGKKKVKHKNFFPGYILLEADLDDITKRFLAKIPGLMGIVGAKNFKGQNLSPIPLRDAEIKRIKAILNEESQTEKIDIRLSQGDPVKVTSGPFNNFNGTVLEVNAEKMKVKVMVSIFGRKTPIDLDFTQIEKQK
jgi:transcriptional antiterminator NusG